MISTPSDGFGTPEMDQAERELDGRIDHALAKARELQAKVDDVEASLAKDEPPSDQEVERFRAYIVGHAKTEEWQRVIERIARGELTWRQIVEGMVMATGHVDAGVKAAFASLSTVPPASMEELVEIGVLPEPAPPADAEQAEQEQPEPDQSDYFASSYEEDEWEGHNPLRGRG